MPTQKVTIAPAETMTVRKVREREPEEGRQKITPHTETRRIDGQLSRYFRMPVTAAVGFVE